MRLLLLTLLLFPTFLLSQCEVYIVPGSSIAYDHNPGISFGFEIQNDSDVPYMGGTLGVNFLLCNDDVWDFGFNLPAVILPGGSKYIGTPVFDIPLPENAQDWYCYNDPDNPDNYFPWYLYLDGQEQINGEYCWDAVTDPTQPNGYFNNPLSDGCDNPDGDIFCNDGCDIEVVDFDLETGELTIIPYSTYCPNNNSPSFENQYPFDNPHIFGFQLNFNWGINDLDISIGGQNIYTSNEPITIDLSSLLNNLAYENMIESINEGEFCDLTLTIYNLNNSGEPLWLAPDNQSIELIDLCPVVEEVDLSLDTMTYTIGCEFGPPNWDDPTPYWIPELQLTNQGDIPITEWCVKFQVLGQSNDTICFNSITILPGETYIQDWPNVYDWGVLSIHILHVNGVSENFWEDFGEDNFIANNMYTQVILNEGWCEPEEIPGCTIEQACNYNPEATVNDGSCDFESCAGCMDPEASNYDPEATVDNPNLCEYDILGCTDETAFNYNPLATVDDGSCIPVIVGCMIPTALNYNPDANTTCVPIDECCIFPIEGCTDPEATNYNPEANVDDGSCKYDVYGCTDPEAINYNPEATIDDGSCVYDDNCNGVFAPNTFTPNNDGVNDIWTLVTDPSCWLDWQILIYNRWGQLVWESTTPGEVWVGSYSKGNHYIADGIYIYVAKGVGYNSANTFQKTGYITIFR
jgi:gliding motility-associated-like protein